MFSLESYQLIDFGEGRRLERFGPVVLDRPCPSAEGLPRDDPAAWERADAYFQRTRGDEGRWIDARGLPPRWTVACGPMVLELKRTEFGQVGLFPEQQVNWDWISAASFGACAGSEYSVTLRVTHALTRRLEERCSPASAPGAPSFRLHRRGHACGGRGRGGGDPRRRGPHRCRRGPPQRRAFRSIGGEDPLDRGRRAEVRRPGVETRQSLRRRDPRSAELRPRCRRWSPG